MSWNRTTIGAHCIVTSSKRFHLEDRSDSGVPFYCSKQIIQMVNGENVTDYDYIREEAYEQVKKQFGVPITGDLLITTRGTYGVPYLYRDSDKFYFADGNLTWLKDFDKSLLPEFLYYWIRSYEGQSKINAIAKGTAQKAVPISDIKDIVISLPSINTQRRISEILSAYDKLIETNQRQIKLLEEAAQRLYKKWFVDLRFPGHENALVVDGVPEGWHQGALAEIVTFKRGKTITKMDIIEGNVPVVAGGLEPAYFHNTSNTKAPVITVSGSGANAGFTRLYYEDVFASDCSFADTEATPDIYYVYCYLKYNKDKMDSLQKGSAQPHVYAKDINAMEMVVPNPDLIASFCKRTKVLFDSVGVLQKQSVFASEARDRLLPKLMNGEIEV